MTRLARLLHYTSLSQALFSKPLSPIGPTQPSRGNVTRRVARWAFQDGHLVSFCWIFLFFFWFVSFHTFPCCPLSPVSIQKLQYCLSLALCLYLLFWFVVLIIVQPPHPPLSFRYSCSLCVIEFCPGCYGIPVGRVSHMAWDMLGGSLTLYSPTPVAVVWGLDVKMKWDPVTENLTQRKNLVFSFLL